MASPTVTEAPFHVPFLRLWRDWTRPHRRYLAFAVSMALIVALTTGAYSKLIQMVMTGLEEGNPSVVWWGPLSVICLTTTSGLSQYFKEIMLTRAVTGMETGLRKTMFSRLVGTDLAQLQSEPPAGLAARFSSDITLAGKSVRAVIGAISSVATIIVTVGFMISIDWSLTLVMVGIFLLALLPVNVIGRHLRRLSRRTQVEIAHMTSEVSEGLSGIRMARTYRLEEPLSRSADSVFDRLFGLRIKQNQWQARVTPVLEFLMGLAIAVLLFVVSVRIQDGTITIADFTGLLTGVGVLAGPARKLGGTFATAMQGRAALDRVFGLFDVRNTILDGPETMGGAKGDIRFKNVSFAYPDGHLALEDFSFEVTAGTKVALVGRSGAGKSTVFNLLPRLYDVTAGEVYLDGTETRRLTLSSLRDQIAVVSQESVLFTGTVAENIGFGRNGASRSEIIAAAEAAAADGFIRKLPQGYDTPVIPSENSFSGGERQRISIARAILRDAPVLLLDEATSALDAQSEKQVQQAIDGLSHGRTTLVIAHRLSTISNSDLILVMDKGRLVEQGAHSELLARQGLYADLYTLQFGEM